MFSRTDSLSIGSCSISFDSGNGDDLSSSCDSSVILDSAGGVQVS